METLSNFFRSSVPNYFQNLPLPRSVGGVTKLSLKEWAQLVPFFASLGLVGYVTYKEINDCFHRKEHAWVNKDYCKEKKKIADIISKNEINDALDQNEKVVYCRCWKSKKFPYCDGSHVKHNEVTGDNVGPLVFNKK